MVSAIQASLARRPFFLPMLRHCANSFSSHWVDDVQYPADQNISNGHSVHRRMDFQTPMLGLRKQQLYLSDSSFLSLFRSHLNTSYGYGFWCIFGGFGGKSFVGRTKIFHNVGMGLFAVITAFLHIICHSRISSVSQKGLHISLYNLSRNSKAFSGRINNRR